MQSSFGSDGGDVNVCVGVSFDHRFSPGDAAGYLFGSINSIRLPKGSSTYSRSQPWLIPGYMASCALQARRQFPQTIHNKGRMCFASGRKILLHAEVNLQRASLKPTPAACGEIRRLGNLGDLQQVSIERSGFVLAAGRHCKLDVI
jgi:hypothetical protein